MNVDDAGWADFQAWAGLNTVFWKQYDLAGATGEGAIYVDLMHDHPGYLMRNLLAGRLLGLKLRRPVIGLTGDVGIVPVGCPGRSVPALAALAQSFGVELLVIDGWNDTATFSILLKDGLAAAGLDMTARGPAVRDFLVNWTLDDGLPIGRLLYDTFLRIHFIETLDFVDESVIAVGANLVALLQSIDAQFSAQAPLWFVMGHSDYSPYGLIADRALRHEGRCLFIRNEGFVRAHILKGAPRPGQTLQGKMREQTVPALLKQYESLLAGDRDHLFKHVDLIGSHGFHLSHRALPQPVARPAGEVLRTAQSFVLTELGLNPGAPTIVLYTITFSDIALNDAQVFADNYAWLEEVLAFARNHPEINWVIRVHPYDEIYNVTGAVRRLMAMYAGVSHIHFLARESSPQVGFLIADMATTIRGSPAIMAAYLGIPVVLCGRGAFSDLGLADVADSREAYFRMLLEATRGAKAADSVRDAAAAFIFDNEVLFNVHSTFLGDFGEATEADYWQRQVSRSKAYDPMGDQFARALFDALDADLPRVSLPVWQNFLPGAPGGGEQAEGAEISFCRQDGARVIPVLSRYEAESWARWLPEGRSAFLIHLAGNMTGPVSVRIRCQGFVHGNLPRPKFRLELNGCATDEIEIDTPEMTEFSLTVHGLGELHPGYQFLGIVMSGGGSPADVGLSEDGRHLSVAVDHIRIVAGDGGG